MRKTKFTSNPEMDRLVPKLTEVVQSMRGVKYLRPSKAMSARIAEKRNLLPTAK